MKSELKYIELKTGFAEDGPAWIGFVEYSKSGKTMYFNNKALLGNGHGEAWDRDTGDKYWVSGVKQKGSNRHPVGKGKIYIDRNAVQEYLDWTGQQKLDIALFQEVIIEETNKSRFNEMANAKLCL
jgi:hypothetical protein